ncbi:hypothetical protein PsYK624_027630 [Phanerochaete sordida]|uniref:Uncharacterized protein n=1 Tax=Phanerochaete sordida TaxID=48140 RepID=A0A9P3LAD9_9APHY|nr:hypothetical protein PsYK624_027630 [Phanerochaete sordida]
MSGRRNRTKSSANPPARAGQSSKQAQAPPPAKPTTTSAPAKSAPAPAPPKATSPPVATQTPSARLRQEWKSFEGWLHARRAARDKQISDKLKEVMSTKNKSKRKQSSASDTADLGAFEDKLNQDLADAAQTEWWRRVDAAGLNLEDWDMTAAEMAAVEAAFIPQQRGSRTVEEEAPPQPQPQPQPVVDPPKAKPAATAKAGSSPFAARVEEESKIPGAWSAPSPPPVPEQGVMGRNRPYTPMAQLAQKAFGLGGSQAQQSVDPSPEEKLWESKMKKKLQTSNPPPSESLWEQQATMSKATALESTGNKLPTAELLWEMNRGPTPKPSTQPPVESESDSLWSKALGKKPTTPAPPAQLQHDAESLWDMQQNSLLDDSDWHNPSFSAATKTPSAPTPPIKNALPSRTSAPSRSSASSKSLPGKSPLSQGWDTTPEVDSSSLPGSTIGFPTPASSTYTGAYNYLSPVFVEMEDETFPRIPDPLPEAVVEESIRAFHTAAAEAEIDLRRQLVSGILDDGAIERLVNTHVINVEQHARKVVEEWHEERAAEEQRQRLAEEQRRRQAEARRQGLNKNRFFAGAVGGGARAASPAPAPVLQAKRLKQINSPQARLLQESFGTRPSTPAHLAQARQDDDAGGSLWERQMSGKASAPAAEDRGIFNAFLGSSPPSQAPAPMQPPQRSVSPWSQLAKPPTQRNPFLQQQPAPAAPAAPALSPWEAMLARTRQQAPPVPQTQPEDAWDEDNTDESDEGSAPWGQNMLSNARGGAANVWDMAMNAFGGAERPRTPAQAGPSRPAAPAPPPPVSREPQQWADDGLFARSTSNGPTTPEDPRFVTWRPPRIVDPDEHVDPAKKMQDLALQNLFHTVDDADDSDLMNAMSMYSKAAQSVERKKTAGPGRR